MSNKNAAELMTEREKEMKVPEELAETPMTPYDAIDIDEAIDPDNEPELAPEDPFKGIAYFVIPTSKMDILNQAIDLVPDSMPVLKRSIVEAINSILVPITDEQIEEAVKKANKK